MDGIDPWSQPVEAAFDMPPPAPLAMPRQSFATCPARRRIPPPEPARWAWRILCLGGGTAIAAGLVAGLTYWMRDGGLSWLEGVILALVGAAFLIIGIMSLTALCGALWRPRRALPVQAAEPLSVALLIPVYHEDPSAVTANALAMLRSLAARQSAHHFTLYLLSDTRSDLGAEAVAFARLQDLAPPEIAVHYRNRAENTDRKTGNIADWLRRWGGHHEAMIVLDSDSLMGAETLLALTDDMASDPDAGLIQTCPQIIDSRTLFARTQQFAAATYGPALGRGLALWWGKSGNFWGHNAIIRTRAFAGACGLPHLRGRRGRTTLIWSHDFVEAALLRRAGWAVRLRADLGESFEETPPSLIDHMLRDRRWCQGNLQHLRLLNAAGLHPLSRLHLAFGAAGYLLSLCWLGLLATWTVLGSLPMEQSAWQYFSEAAPHRPAWPEVSPISSWWFLAAMYGLLLVPRLVGLGWQMASGARRAGFGGAPRMLGAALQELAFSVLYAPAMMVQQCLTVLRVACGITVGWTPQNRQGGRYPWRSLWAFHRVETLAGIALTAAIASGSVTLWLSPIALCLLFTVPLSRLSARPVGPGWLATPQSLAPTGIQQAAETARDDLRRLAQRAAAKIAAE